MKKQRSWDELVVAGRAAVGRRDGAQWELGDLTLEVAPLGAVRGSQPLAGGALKKFAAEIGIAYKTLHHYREAASHWPPEQRQYLASFTSYVMLAYYPQRFELMRKLQEQAQRKGRRIREEDVRRAMGRAPVRRRITVQDDEQTVPVAEHQRRRPGTVRFAPVTSIRKPLDTAKGIVDNLKPGQIGELIEYAWSVLEGKRAA